MEKKANVCIDHVTIYCKSMDILTNVMKPLGFFSKNNTHYMFRNNYLEGYEVKPSDPPYPFYSSKGALHSFIFWCDNVDASRARLEAAGYEFLYPTMEFTRPADHGEEKGDATFRGTYMKTEVLPVGEVATVQHKNPELIYPPHPDTNPNTACSMTQIFVAVPTLDIGVVADRFAKTADLIRGDAPPHQGMNELVVSDAETFRDKTGVRIDPKRSACVGIRFAVADMDKMMQFAEASGLSYHVLKSGTLCVDAAESLNLFMLFDKE